MHLATRVLGFAIPTVALVTAFHVSRDARSGEWFDGIVSGLAFTLPFIAVAWFRSRLEGDRPSARARSAGQEILFGFLAAAFSWTALWVGWSFPAMQAQRENAFWWNCAMMAFSALLLPAPGRGRRGDDEPVEEPLAT